MLALVAAAGPAGATTYPVTATIGVGLHPAAVAVDPGTHTVFVANATGDSVSVIDENTNTVTATIPLPSGANPVAVAVDPGSRPSTWPTLATRT